MTFNQAIFISPKSATPEASLKKLEAMIAADPRPLRVVSITAPDNRMFWQSVAVCDVVA